MSDSDLIKENEKVAHRVFRFYSRKVFLAPNNRHFHEQRINAALLLTEKEPLQGAVADFFYGCWFDIPYDVNNLFTRIKDRLTPEAKQGFRDCIDKKSYIQRNSMLATRWSVLVSPSLNEQKQRLRISSCKHVLAKTGARLSKLKMSFLPIVLCVMIVWHFP